MSAALVQLRGVTVLLGGHAALSSVDFMLSDHESWAVLGPNGSGKSTLLRTLRGEVWPHHQGGGQRVFRLGGAPEESPIGVRRRIGLVSPEGQEEYVRRDWALPVEAVVRSGFTDDVWPPEAATPEQAVRIAEVLSELGVAALARRSVLELSSGEARKVMLARALVGRPRAVFLDEPCHGLDAASRASFLRLVSEVVRTGTPIVLATHRYDELVPEIGKVAVMHGGRILAQGEREEVLRGHGRRRTTTPNSTSTSTSTPTSNSNSTSNSSAARSRPRDPAPVRDERGQEQAPGRYRGQGFTEPLFVLEHADVRVDGHPVLHDLSWTVRRGESWAVVGPNGAGKSTLLRLLVGDEQAMPGGKVSRLSLGERASVWDVKARVGIVSPELQARHRLDLVAEDVVASGFTASIGIDGPPSPAERAMAGRAMAELGVSHLAGRRIHRLSYGELRRVLLARALVRGPELLVLDEPCDGLDPESRAALLDGIEGLCRAGRQIVLVTHHQEDLVPSIGHVLALDRGRAVYQGRRAAWPGQGAP